MRTVAVIVKKAPFLRMRVRGKGLKEIKREVLQSDWEDCTTEASRHNSTATAARIATETSWMKLWDMALDYGPYGTASLQALYRELTRPLFQPGICHICDAPLDVSYFHHYTLSHTPLSDSERIITSLLCASRDIFMYAKHFKTIIRSYSSSFFVFMPCHCIWLECKYGIW